MRSTTSLVNVSNRLPVTIKGGQITRSSGGLVAALEGLPKEQFQATWIGWPGAGFADEHQRSTFAEKLSGENGCVPVFLSEEQTAGFYEGFSNSSLWPLLHYLPIFLRYEPAWWEQYRKVNELFAEKVLEVSRPGDLIWVHDYHLMLLPAILRAANANLKIGFFLHTPFPAHEVFRCHPQRRELVAGMLGANLIGFHAFGYLRHFCGSVRRILRIETELTHIATEDHIAELGVYPIGINAQKFQETLESKAFHRRKHEFRQAHEGKRIIVSVERMDYTKGILHRLEAIDIFLSQWKQIDKIRFVFVSVPSRERIEEYKQLLAEVESRVGQLNGKYATLLGSPIHFIHGAIPFVDLCAIYSAADIAVVTPLVDGMNLVAKEFVGCQQENAGLLILSEFAGAAEELFNAVLVNPYDSTGVAEALRQALAMSIAERRSRALPMRDHVLQYDARHWARSFINHLASITVNKPNNKTGNAEELYRQFTNLSTANQKLALFLDYDGTLREIERDPGAATPTSEIRLLLDRLSERPDLEVTILSGRSQSDLEDFLGDKPIRLVAEHGASWRLAGSKEWERLDKNHNYDWQQKLLPILRTYQQSTPGSSIEEKHSSIVWHYRKADEEFGAWKANRLTQELAALTANHPIKVLHGRKMVEVSATENNKGAIITRVVEQNGPFVAVCCAGDDSTDEDMFELKIPGLFSIKVGSGRTQAHFRVSDPPALRRLLERLFLKER